MRLTQLTATCNACLTLLAVSANASILVVYDFENHTAGDLLGGPVGTPRSTATSTHGDAFDYTANTTAANTTVSTLQESGPSDWNSIGVNVRQDTLGGMIDGGFSGNFLEIHPARVTNFGATDMNPATFGGDYLFFTIEPVAGYGLSLESFSYDRGGAEGATDDGSFTFRTQPWYSLDGGSSWSKMTDNSQTTTPTGTDLAANFEADSQSIDLTGVSALQNVTGEIAIALAVADNSGRSAYSSNEVSPVAHYLDNIQLAGDVLAAVPEPSSLVVWLTGLIGPLALRGRRA